MNWSPRRRDLRVQYELHEPTRIQGGNWNMQGFRHSGLVDDEDECQMAIAEFMDDTQVRSNRQLLCDSDVPKH